MLSIHIQEHKYYFPHDDNCGDYEKESVPSLISLEKG